MGQSREGMSILWMYLEWVEARQAIVRPWKAPVEGGVEFRNYKRKLKIYTFHSLVDGEVRLSRNCGGKRMR